MQQQLLQLAALAADANQIVSGTALGADDFTVIAYNKFGGTVTTGAPELGCCRRDRRP